MTPKEKAQYLIDKYMNADLCWEFTRLCAKQCALIAVEEILESVPSYKYWDTYSDDTQSAITFWNEVKEELKSL